MYSTKRFRSDGSVIELEYCMSAFTWKRMHCHMCHYLKYHYGSVAPPRMYWNTSVIVVIHMMCALTRVCIISFLSSSTNLLLCNCTCTLQKLTMHPRVPESDAKLKISLWICSTLPSTYWNTSVIVRIVIHLHDDLTRVCIRRQHIWIGHCIS